MRTTRLLHEVGQSLWLDNISRPQRPLWASTGTKDSKASDILFCEAVLAQFAAAGIDVERLAVKLQQEGAEAFVKSWDDLMTVISSKSASLGARVAGVNS